MLGSGGPAVLRGWVKRPREGKELQSSNSLRTGQALFSMVAVVNSIEEKEEQQNQVELGRGKDRGMNQASLSHPWWWRLSLVVAADVDDGGISRRGSGR